MHASYRLLPVIVLCACSTGPARGVVEALPIDGGWSPTLLDVPPTDAPRSATSEPCDPFAPPVGCACRPIDATSGRCRPLGFVSHGGRCHNLGLDFDQDCAAGTECVSVREYADECRRICRTSADCVEDGSVCSGPEVAPGVRTCSDGCSPGRGTCPTVRCELVEADGVSGGECVSPVWGELAGLGEACVPGRGDCTVIGSACVAVGGSARCLDLCDPIGSACPRDTRCTPLPSPLLVDGTERGYCPR
jgi:hypothetical protein